MPGLKGRFSTVIKSKVSKQLDRAENPAETLDYAYERQMEDLQKVRQGIANIATAKKQMEAQIQQRQEQSDKLAGQARDAIGAGREDLARVALERKQQVTDEIGPLQQQVSELASQQTALTESERKLQERVADFRSKKEVMKAQYSAAEAQVQVSEAATGIGDSGADIGLAMQRALDKTETMKARAAAADELEAAGTFQDLTALGPPEEDIDRQLDQLTTKSAVDDELAKLKAELGSGGEQPALPAAEVQEPPKPETEESKN